MRDKAREDITRRRRIVDAILDDLAGLEGAILGWKYFEEGGESYSFPGLPEYVRLSDRAARFCGIAD